MLFWQSFPGLFPFSTAKNIWQCVTHRKKSRNPNKWILTNIQCVWDQNPCPNRWQPWTTLSENWVFPNFRTVYYWQSRITSHVFVFITIHKYNSLQFNIMYTEENGFVATATELHCLSSFTVYNTTAPQVHPNIYYVCIHPSASVDTCYSYWCNAR
jgi:hypothetical protein